MRLIKESNNDFNQFYMILDENDDAMDLARFILGLQEKIKTSVNSDRKQESSYIPQY